MKIWIPVIRADTGADTYFSELARGLGQAGVEVTLSWLPRIAEQLPQLYARLPVPAGTDIIHCNSWNGFAFARRGVKLFVSVLHWVHGIDYATHRGILQAQYHRLIRHYEERSLRAADRVIAISDYTRSRVMADFPGIDPQRVYPGVDTDRFVPVEGGHGRTGRFRLLYLGSPSRRKGFHLLPGIMSRLGEGFVLGYNQGPGRPPAPNMEFLGRLSEAELVRAYQRCDALIFPTTYEGFGYVAAEAMACGKPVIASRCSALPELVVHGETGILCPVGDVDAFVSAARQLGTDSDMCRRFGDAGRRRVAAQFGFSSMIERHLHVYESALG